MHSTQTALVKLVKLVKLFEDVWRASDNRQATLLVLLDFSKAFDTVDHMLLLRKLRDFNVSASTVRWFHSYLNGQRQVVLSSERECSS